MLSAFLLAGDVCREYNFPPGCFVRKISLLTLRREVTDHEGERGSFFENCPILRYVNYNCGF